MKTVSDIFFNIGLVVGVAAAVYCVYFVWTMNWGTGSRNFGIGVAMLVFIPMVAFGVSVFVFGMIGAYLESLLARWGR
jgi:hypothetical protein